MIERRVIRDIGTVLVSQLADGVKSSLMKLRGGLSGDDSGLSSVWEELCVQVQGEESCFWDSYVELIDNAVRAALADLPLPLQQAVSFKTDLGDDWLDTPGEDGVVPVFEDEVVDLVRSSVLNLAADYESPEIERFKCEADSDEDEDEDDWEEEDEEDESEEDKEDIS